MTGSPNDMGHATFLLAEADWRLGKHGTTAREPGEAAVPPQECRERLRRLRGMEAVSVAARVIVFALAFALLPSRAQADELDCDGEFATDKIAIDLGDLHGGPLRFVACTDAGDPVLGRAYVEYRDRVTQSILRQELAGMGGCGAAASHAMRDGDELLVTHRTCQSREYHPEPEWIVRAYRFDQGLGRFVERPRPR